MVLALVVLLRARRAGIAWRLAGDAADETSAVPLGAVPGDARDGEIFFVLSADGAWSVEYAPQLRLDRLP